MVTYTVTKTLKKPVTGEKAEVTTEYKPELRISLDTVELR